MSGPFNFSPQHQENVMCRTTGGLGLGAVAGFLLLGVAAPAADKAKKIAPDKLPKKIKAAVHARFPGARATSAEREVEGGRVVYDIELRHKGRKYEMDILKDGTVIEIEKEVAAKDVPQAVTRTVKAKFPKASIKEVMEVNKVKGKKETPHHYEVVLVTGGKEHEIEVSLNGKLLKGGKAEADK
jgi:uncharacterized membrane protein YkoI